MKKVNLDTFVIIALVVTGVMAVAMAIWFFKPVSVTINNVRVENPGPLTGLECPDPSLRPVAVMLGSDAEARPLSGVGQADMVFEMPVTPNGITRLMAVFQCGPDPKEIGSIRSSRQDFIPLAQGLDSIYAHWGGEAGALEQLNEHVTDNVDALLFEGTVFYRKKGVPAPHNGFSNLKLLRQKAADLGYVASASLPAYPHLKADAAKTNLTSLVGSVRIDWPAGMDVRFDYDPATQLYARFRGGSPEIDKNSGQQVKVAVIVDMKTTSSFLRDQYINVRTLGQGDAFIYQNGIKIPATWKKVRAGDMLTFIDAKGQPIPLAPGPIWVLVDAPLPQP